MGEAKAKEAEVAAGMQARLNGAAPVRLTPQQAAVIAAMDLAVHVLTGQANQLKGFYGHAESATELGKAAEHLAKYRVRFHAAASRQVALAGELPK